MRHVWSLLLALCFAPPTLAAEPFARVSMEDADDIVPGQQVHVSVEVFVPDFFTSPPQYPLFELNDALVTLSSDRAQNLVQTVDGVQYSGIRRGYTVVPQKSGKFSLPVIDVEAGYPKDGNPVKAAVRVTLPSFEVEASAASQLAGAFAARDLTISQTFDPDPATLKAGDALVRTVVVFASDTQAMLIPPVDFPDPSGLVQYRKPPIIGDNVERRGIGRTVETGSTRTETVVYTTSSAGKSSIPALSYGWFDLDTRTMSTATLPAVDMVVAATTKGDGIRPTLKEQVASAGSRTRAAVAITLASLAVLIPCLAIWKFRPDLHAVFAHVRASYHNSLRHRLRVLRGLIGGAGEMDIYRGLRAWSESLGHKSLTCWAQAERNDALMEQLQILEGRLFDMSPETLDREALSRSITPPTRTRPRMLASSLPSLNPT